MLAIRPTRRASGEADDLPVSLPEQQIDEVTPDETGRAGHERHRRPA
jgi:hypothetical protein